MENYIAIIIAIFALVVIVCIVGLVLGLYFIVYTTKEMLKIVKADNLYDLKEYEKEEKPIPTVGEDIVSPSALSENEMQELVYQINPIE